MILVLPVSMLLFAIMDRQFIFSDFDAMLLFIGESIITGYAAGVIIYLFKWRYNERKFIRLTDPLNEYY
jgi:hypothetical protein